jgi:catechol 2,3-dioxygenase-like lactoylglutathione lyase family enzyme
MGRVNVRYIVSDVDAAIPFYTDMLDFKVVMHPAPGFASLSRGDLQLLLNRPGAGGAGQAMSTGQLPSPGGWNRIQIEVDDIEATVEKLKTAGARFRNEIVTGNGGKQILIEDRLVIRSNSFSPSEARSVRQKRKAGHSKVSRCFAARPGRLNRLISL